MRNETVHNVLNEWKHIQSHNAQLIDNLREEKDLNLEGVYKAVAMYSENM